MNERAAIRDEDLHAYIDGALDDARRAEVAILIGRDPVLAHRVAQFRADRSQLVSVYGGIADRPLPKEWLARIEGKRPRRRLPESAIAAAAASLLVLLIGAAAWRELGARDNIVAEALAARNDALQPQQSLPASAASGSRLTAVLGTHAKIPDLAKLGYRLTRFEIYGDMQGRRAVELVYSDAANRAFTLYLRRAASAPRFDQFERGGTRICIWQDDVLGMVMAGKMSAAEMQRLASLSYTGLTL